MICFKRSEEVEQQVEDAVEQNRGEDTSLEQADIEGEELRCPFLGGDLRTELLVVVEDKALNVGRHVIPVERKLDEVMPHTAVRVGEVDPREHNGPLLGFGFAEGFKQRERVFNAARNTKKETLLCRGVDVLVFHKK